MAYTPKSSILKLTGLPTGVLDSLCDGKPEYGILGWKRERDGVEAEIIAKAMESKAEDLKQVCGLTTGILIKQLTIWIAREDQLSPKELKLVSDIQANIDRIFRLENKTPTSINEERVLTPDNVREQMKRMYEDLKKLDPMVDYEEPDAGPEIH